MLAVRVEEGVHVTDSLDVDVAERDPLLEVVPSCEGVTDGVRVFVRV